MNFLEEVIALTKTSIYKWWFGARYHKILMGALVTFQAARMGYTKMECWINEKKARQFCN